jgi:hypothetical protein
VRHSIPDAPGGGGVGRGSGNVYLSGFAIEGDAHRAGNGIDRARP